MNIKNHIKEYKDKNKYKKACKNKIDNFHRNFREIMFEESICDNFDRTITPTNIKLINNGGADGVICELKFPKGLNINYMDKAQASLAQNVYGKCMVYIEDQFDSPVTFSAIRKWHDIKYTPIKDLNASQLFLGYTIDLQPVIIDFSKYPHMLITGGSGGGKSKLVEIIMTNLAVCNEPSELNLYYLQLSKDDNFKYELLKHCKGCVTATSCSKKIETYKKALKMIKHVHKEMMDREKLVKEKLGRESEDINIHIYNKKFNKKLPVIQLWIDEAATLYKRDSDKDINKIIEEMRFITEQIASAGRFVGVYLVNVMQRASKEELPREIKINSMNWVSFNQVDGGASKVAIGDETSAVGLPQRVFVVKPGGQNIKFAKTPFSSWDKNVKELKDKDKIRKNVSKEIEDDYAVWNITEIRTEDNNKKNNTSKIVNKELNRLNAEILNYKSLVSSLKEQIENLKRPKNSNSCLSINNIIDKNIDILNVGYYKQSENEQEKVNFLDFPQKPAVSRRVVDK